jgi:Flp pilus assembly protein TadG
VVQNLLITTLLLVVLVLAVNMLIGLYARGAVRSAAADAARQGARFPVETAADRARAEAACLDRARSIRSGLLRSSWGDAVQFRCDVTNERVRVTATGSMPWFIALPGPGIPLDAQATFGRRPASTEVR